MQSAIRKPVVNGGPGRSPDAERDPKTSGLWWPGQESNLRPSR